MGLVASKESLDKIKSSKEKKIKELQQEARRVDAEVSTTTIGRFLRGEPVRKDNFKYISNKLGEDWRVIVDRSRSSSDDFEPKKDWEQVPYVPTFYGRDLDLQNLAAEINTHHYRIFILCGNEGIGKTALAVKLADRVLFGFDCIMWYPLRNAPPLKDFLTRFSAKFLSGSNLLRNTDLLSQLIKFIRNNRCLVILDNFEAILGSGNYAGEYQEQYKDYGNLIKCILEGQHESCFVIISRERPIDIKNLVASDLPVRLFDLEGLQPEACSEIFKAKGLSEESFWRSLAENYRGYPLYIKLISEYIKKKYNGSVGSFLKKANSLLTKDIKIILRRLFDTLPCVEKNILCEIAKHEDSVSSSKLQEILSLSDAEFSIAIESLKERTLIEENTSGYTLQPVVKEYIINFLN